MQDFSHIIETSKDGVLSTNSSRAHVEEVLQRAINSQKPIVLHLHGGLVPKESAYAIVNRLKGSYLSANIFPIFIIWRTGLLDAVQNVGELANRPFFRRIFARLIAFFVAMYGAPGGKALASGDEPDAAEIEEALSKLERGEVLYKDVTPKPKQETITPADEAVLLKTISDDKALKADWELEVEFPESVAIGKGLTIDDEVRNEAREKFTEPRGKSLFSGTLLAVHAVRIASRVIKRFYNHRDHGLHATIIEEVLREFYIDQIGTEVWQFMKQDSLDTFDREAELPERGGWLLMRLLGEEAKTRKATGQSLSVSIVGHSAGCIYAVNLLTYLHRARSAPSSPWNGIPFQVDKLVFLAPAATCKVMSGVLQLHSDSPLFQSFRMYSLRDVDEKGYYEIPLLYPGSLLYIISGLLESVDDGACDMPLVGMQRFGRQNIPFTDPEVTEVWQFLSSNANRLVWSGDKRGPGLNCDASKHGNFDSSPDTVASILHFLNYG